jgi:hypothetical protein
MPRLEPKPNTITQAHSPITRTQNQSQTQQPNYKLQQLHPPKPKPKSKPNTITQAHSPITRTQNQSQTQQPNYKLQQLHPPKPKPFTKHPKPTEKRQPKPKTISKAHFNPSPNQPNKAYRLTYSILVLTPKLP